MKPINIILIFMTIICLLLFLYRLYLWRKTQKSLKQIYFDGTIKRDEIFQVINTNTISRPGKPIKVPEEIITQMKLLKEKWENEDQIRKKQFAIFTRFHHLLEESAIHDHPCRGQIIAFLRLLTSHLEQHEPILQDIIRNLTSPVYFHQLFLEQFGRLLTAMRFPLPTPIFNEILPLMQWFVNQEIKSALDSDITQTKIQWLMELIIIFQMNLEDFFRLLEQDPRYCAWVTEIRPKFSVDKDVDVIL